MNHLSSSKALWKTGQYENVRARNTRVRYLPWAVLVFMLAASWQLWKSAERHALQARQTEFNLRVQSAVDRVRQRMLNYEQVLHGMRGFINNQHEVEHREFRGYIKSLGLTERFPGIQGVSYAPFVPAQHKQAHIAGVRRDGLADYNIKPEGVRDAYAPVAYIEPYAGRNLRVLGFDNFSSPLRKASLEKARDLDRAILSEKLQLVQEDGQAPQPGCLMLLPVYKAGAAHETQGERRANIAGWLAASFRMNDLMEGLLARDADELDIEIFDGNEAAETALLFDSDDHASRALSHLFQTSLPIELAGHSWLISAHSLPTFEAGVDKSKAYLTLLAAFLLSILLTGITALLVRDRSRAMLLAEGASNELRQRKEFQVALQENEQRWKLALEGAGHGVWDWNMSTDEIVCTPLSKQMRGYSVENYPYRYFREWGTGVHPDDQHQLMAALQEHLEGKSPNFIFEYRALCQNGEWKWIISRGMVVERDAQGKPLRMIGTHTDISERREMRTALEEEKKFSDDIINSLPGNFYMLDAHGHHIRWNKNVERVTGYTAEELGRIEARDMFDGEEREAVQKKIREIFEQGEGEIEAGLLTKNGEKIPYHFSARRTFIAGQPYLVGVGFDISQRRAMEAALKVSQQQLRLFISHAPVRLAMFDRGMNYLACSREWSATYGKEPEALIGHNSYELHPDVPASWRSNHQQAMAGETLINDGTEWVRSDGRKIWVRWMITPWRDESGEIGGIIIFSEDISERKRAEEALRESEERYREIFRAANYFIFTLDPAQRITYISSVLGQQTGYDEKQLIGEHIGKILTPESLRKAQQMMSLKLQGEAGVTQYEVELLGKDGQIVPVEVSTSLIYKQGKVVGVQGAGRDITERYKYEQALRESEEKYRGLFENVGDLAYSSNLEGNFVMVNDALLELTGYSREELVGAPIRKLLTPENFEIAGKMTTAKLTGERQVTRYELELTAKDGRQLPVEIVSTLVYKDGKPVRVQGIGRDIGERKRAEDALRRSERNYREILEQAAEAIFIADHDGKNYVEVNRAACEMLGYTREELLGIGFRHIFHPEDMARNPIRFDDMWAGQVIHTSRRFRRKDGTYIPVELSARMLGDGRLQAVGRDVSEWLAREEALQRSERNYRELMEQAAEAIFVTDHEGRHCVEVNQAACDMLGYSREELLAIEVRDIFHPEEIKIEPIKFDEVRAGGTTITKRRFRRKDGSDVPVELSSRMLSDGRLQAMVRDISEWLAREAALQAANAKAEAASRAKGEFLANMSHEIRTPMNSVIGMTRLALNHETNPGQRGYLEKILLSGEHLLGIIDEILDFSKIDAGKLKMESVDLNLGMVMDNLHSLVAGKAVAKGLSLRLELDPAIPAHLRGDPLRLRQVLLNFTDNAIKFTAQGEVVVSMRMIEDSDAGCLVQFEVRDTGIGISTAELANLFNSFQQADGSVTRKYGGTGLGLAISKRLVEEIMAGELGVESTPGRGSTFWFRVRLLHSDGATHTAVAQHLLNQQAVRDTIRGAHVLLVENNLFNQQVAREFLEDAEVLVVIANNGLEALDLLRQEQFDAVLMDVQMPVMGGLEATQHIRSELAYAQMPVIAMTANALEGERERCLAVGMNDFIAKPVRPEMLYAILAKYLSPELRHGHMPATNDATATSLAAASPPTAVIDLSELAAMIGGKPEKVREFAHKFIATTRADMDEVEAALQRQDFAALRKLGHHIKSPSRMVGAVAFAELCLTLEQNQGDLVQAQKLVRQLRAMLVQMEAEVKARYP